MPSKSKNEIKVRYFELNSEIDMARYACTFGLSHRPVYAIKRGGKYMLLAEGETISNTKSFYCTYTDRISRFLVYYVSENEENMKMQDIPREDEHYKSYRVPIIELENIPLVERTIKKEAVVLIKAKSLEYLVKDIISNSAEVESVLNSYCFEYKGTMYAGAFNLIPDEKLTTFMYSRCEAKGRFSFFKYSYTNDSIEMVDHISGNSFIFVKVINLKNPFPFFRPE